ncbi:hypothetical protein FQN49_008384 [Arthroderma sp. PD_2]|nr:hypothetical protein FQN49_008384 [Arthroderma sp. PD_2]
MPRIPRRWTPQEDRILLEKGKQLFLECKESNTAISWSSLSKALTNRNNKDCRKRWAKLIGTKRGFWTASEDERLQKGVQKYGSQWTLVAKGVETRNPDLKHYGTNWKDIKRHEFPLRSTTNLKNRHIAISRRSNKVSTSYVVGKDPNTGWLSTEKETLNDIIINGDDFENHRNKSSNTLIATSPPQDKLNLDCTLPSNSFVTDTTPTSPSSGLYDFPLGWEFPSHLDRIETTIPYYAPFENFPGSTSNHATEVGPGLWTDINHCEPSMVPSPPARQTSPNTSQLQTSASMEFGEASQIKPATVERATGDSRC